MKTTLVIGYGNTLRSDDGVGQKVAEIVAGWELEGVRSLPVHQLTPELADDMAQVETVIFVDVYSSLTPPLVRGVGGDQTLVTEVEDDQIIIKTLENNQINHNFGHTSSPEFLLYLTEKLYNTKPQCYWVLIPGINFEFGEELSEMTEAKKAIALQKIREIIM
jgi:hydrogenase maturation protease